LPDNEIETLKDRKDKRFEIMCGIVITFLAAVLAITDLVGGRFGGTSSYAESEKNNAYSWYNAKSIKQSLAEGQRDTLQSLIDAGTVNTTQISTVSGVLDDLNSKIERYNKEKNEILEGSAAVGEENWAQDVNGEMGKVIGANEWDAKIKALGKVGDILDMSVLFLQLSLVLGAIALVFQHPGPRKIFFVGMVLLGIAGIIISIHGSLIGFKVG
jgi:hypothetical protein